MGVGAGVEVGSGAGVDVGIGVDSGVGVGVDAGVEAGSGVGVGVDVGAGAAASEAGAIAAVGDAVELHPARRSSHAVRLSVKQNRKASLPLRSRYGLAARREHSITRRFISGPLDSSRF